jgi:trigger factor
VLLNPDGEVETLDNGRVRTKVYIDMFIMDKAYDSINAYYRNNLDIPGFRKGGNIPESMLMSSVGKEQYFLAVLEEIFKVTLEGAFAKLGDRVLADTETIETPTEEMVKALVTRQPFKYAVSADVLPEVKWSTPYAEMKVKVDTSSYSQPTDEKVEEIIDGFRKEQAQLTIAVGRKVQRGDMCVVEASAVKKDTGEPALGVPEGPFRYDTEVSVLPNFVENLEKLSVGEETEFEVTMPDDWQDEKVRGWDISFKVKVNEIFEKKMPELNDEFAATCAPNVKSLQELRQMLAENLNAGVEDQKLQALQNAFTEAVAECLDVLIPESMIRNIGREEYGKQLMQLQQQGTMTPEMINKLTSQKLVDDYVAKERSTFEMLAKASIGLAEIQKQEGLKLSEEQLEDELSDVKQQFLASGEPEENMDLEHLRSVVKERGEAKLVFGWIEKNCPIEYV